MSVIKTSRLDLSELTLHDAAFILHLLNEKEFLFFIGDKGVRTLSDAREYILKGPMESYRRYGFGLYLTSLRKGGTPIGICGLLKRDTFPVADLGFAFLSQHWSNGYASESTAAVLEHARRTLGLNRIVAITSPENHGSMGVLAKVGMRLEGTIRLVPSGAELNLFGSDRRGATR